MNEITQYPPTYTGPRSAITAVVGEPEAATRRWTRVIRGTTYSFTAITMPDGERRYSASRLTNYGGDWDARWGCAWKRAGFWRVRPTFAQRLADSIGEPYAHAVPQSAVQIADAVTAGEWEPTPDVTVQSAVAGIRSRTTVTPQRYAERLQSLAPVWTRNLEKGDVINPASFSDACTAWPVTFQSLSKAHEYESGLWLAGTDADGGHVEMHVFSSDAWYVAPTRAPEYASLTPSLLAEILAGGKFSAGELISPAMAGHPGQDDSWATLWGLYSKLRTGEWDISGNGESHATGAYRAYLLQAAARELTRNA